MSGSEPKHGGPGFGARRWAARLLGLLFVASIPLCLVGNNVRWVTLSPATYREGFAKYRATERTGLDQLQLEQIAQEFIRYFEGPVGRLEPVVAIGGVRRPLFNEREIVHMEDVQTLMQAVFRLGGLAGLYAVLYVIGRLALQRGGAVRPLGRLLLWGSGLTFGLLLLVASLSLVDFAELFIRFHELSFRNDLWMLDPRSDYLVILFPEGFWLDVTLHIAAMTAAEAALLGAAGILLVRRARAGRTFEGPIRGRG